MPLAYYITTPMGLQEVTLKKLRVLVLFGGGGVVNFTSENTMIDLSQILLVLL